MDAETAKRKANEQKARIEYAERHHFVCEPISPDTKKEHFEFDRNMVDGKEAEHFTFDVSENVVDAMSSTFKALEDEFDFVLEEVIETSLFVFFELMSAPGGSGYMICLTKRRMTMMNCFVQCELPKPLPVAVQER